MDNMCKDELDEILEHQEKMRNKRNLFKGSIKEMGIERWIALNFPELLEIEDRSMCLVCKGFDVCHCKNEKR